LWFSETVVVLADAVDHLVHNILPAAADYAAAEQALILALASF
jgi:hypothetical protein